MIKEKVYGTLSSGVLTFYSIKRDGKSCKKVVRLLGSAIGLVDSSHLGVASKYLSMVSNQSVYKQIV